MTVKSDTYSIGPDNGKLTINTYVGGMGAKMGHDLVFQATKWSGTLDANEDPVASSVQVTIDVGSLEIIEATGGLKPLTDKDKAEIAQNREKTLQSGKYPEITFQSTSVSGSATYLSVQGDLTIMGNTKPVTLQVNVEDAGSDARLTGKTTVVQTEFGVKPYSKLGALKVKDPIDLQVVLTLPSA